MGDWGWPLKPENDNLVHFRFLQGFGKNELAVQTQNWSRGRDALLHVHDYTEFIIIVKGCGLNRIGSRHYPVIPGDVQIIFPGILHSFHADANLRIINLAIPPHNPLFKPEEFQQWEFIPEFQRIFVRRNDPESPNVRIHFSGEDFPKFLFEIDRLKQTLGTSGPEQRLLLRAHLTLLLGSLCRALRKNSAPREIKGNSSLLLSHIFDAVEHLWNQPFDAGKIAEKAGISANYLSEFFRKRTGMPLTLYVNTIKINQGREMLELHPEWNITEIAEKCGFSDPSYFARVYRKLTNESPLASRRKFQKIEYIRKKSLK